MKEMQIFVRSVDGQATAVLRSDPDDSISLLKKMAVPPHASHLFDCFYLMHGCKSLSDASTLRDSCVRDCSTLQLGFRLRGGGGDGGATGAESRDCYLKMYQEKKPDKVDPYEARLARWSRCALSAEALKPPCVIDLLGNIYNKEALVSALLKKSLPKRLGYIKGLKDMIPIHLSSIPGIQSDDEYCATKFQCPITGQEFNGKFRFFALRGCGHVLSVRALKEVQSTSCLVCHTPFDETDKFFVNGSDEEVNVLRQRMEEDKLRLQAKKEKKAKRGITEVDEGRETSVLDVLSFASKEEDISRRKGDVKNHVAVLAKPTGGIAAISVPKKFKASDKVPANATKSVYASIFTSSNKSEFRETYSCRSLPLGRN
ncbi:hypothetical protein O6H91_11G041600 [Diphasiastrum complanatum]|uniref:Uncharacterized protein n=2 Tax=Diphasiastrum complanatum TaxID=34168 RepID=A0ACC2C889_DIPCM|nr:hypothetical protein O6H91_11G041200 [Diphasiastrum complanatum]KAJ7538279.1 hypothetical protein O6H91_11G041600 [Diphasiastrum complanatum]